MKKVIFITGANSGIGFATLKQLAGEGHVVYGSIRDVKSAEKIKSGGGIPVIMDLNDYDTLNKAVEHIISKHGRIDVLVNNAGYGLFGSVEETSIADAKQQFEVNLFSLARLTQLVLPHMRSQKSGKIINMSSMGGKIYTPLGAWYHATKYALEGWSDCLRIELKQFGIAVVIIEPGVIKTSWGEVAAGNIERISSKGPYKNIGKQAANNMRKNYTGNNNASSPEVIARVVSRAVVSSRPKTRYVAGKYARQLLFARKYLGDRAYDWLVLRAIK